MFGLGRKHGKQWVCTVCGYNMVASRPDRCPFCGARSEQIFDSAAISRRYRVTEKPVTENVKQLESVPKLGLEHAAYRIDADGGSVWIDSPAVFTPDLEPVDAILFTHKDFIGAANQYQRAWGAEVWLHQDDAELSIVSQHCVDHPFKGNFEKFGVRGYHIGGHSPGFTVYIWQDVMFVCDYAYPPGNTMKFNPHGNREATREGAGRLADVAAAHNLSTVCGYNYVAEFGAWQKAFARLL
jgi:hydroxyacylglutathione hydrolase